MTVASGRSYIDQRARAELLSSLGAGVLGAGLALLFRTTLGPFAVPLLAIGAVIHALAMYQKHRLDAAGSSAGAAWIAWAYWTCWLLLFALAGYVWWSRF
jgi:hypothetical protein